MTLTSTVTRELRMLAGIAGGPSPAVLVASAAELDRQRTIVKRALATSHVVAVAAELAELVGPDLATLEALGVPVDLLELFPEWRRGSRLPFVPASSGLHLAPAGAAVPLDTVRLQLSPTSRVIPYALQLLRDLLRTLDPATKFVVLVEPGANVDGLIALASRFQPDARARVRFVEMRCITVFAQDNAVAARDSLGRPVLLVPRSFRSGSHREEDDLDPAETERAFGIPVKKSRLFWEGGNVVHDGSCAFVGVDSIAENAARLGLSPQEILAIFESEFGLPLVPLGRLDASRFDPIAHRQSASGQASFHIDLDLSLLGPIRRGSKPRALLADAARGLDFVDAVLRVRRLVSNHFLPASAMRRHLRAEYEASAEARHPLLLEHAMQVAERGYRVIGMPDLRIAPEMDIFQRVSLDFGFCNVLPGLRHGRPSVAHFISGVRALDADAAKRFGMAGVAPVPVCTAEVASALRLLEGGLHCCCGML
jgi:hypothetical protein